MLKENSEKKTTTKTMTFLEDSKSTENVVVLNGKKKGKVLKINKKYRKPYPLKL